MVKLLIASVLSLLIVAALAAPLCAQSFFAPDTNSTRLERVEYVIGASAVFSLADYIGYNLLKQHYATDYYQRYSPPPVYRAAMALLQTSISYILYKECGLSSAISFNLIWWTWGDDFAYYEWEQLLGFFPWDHHYGTGLRFREYDSAGWTPIGLTRPQGSLIARSTLIAQVAIGLSISMAILW